ncbi:Uncharacterised protein [Hafnia alvei]|uniref:Uncharacterized protein n=1 Tax=Hafnia alvei TaxID=569 RepID=A0A377PRG8_HAFAL|nr:Uncharacterised protein [Hafnia alvei]
MASPGFIPSLRIMPVNAVRSEDTHQGIFHRQVEARRTSITLTARTATAAGYRYGVIRDVRYQ